MAPAAGINNSPATPHSGSAMPAVAERHFRLLELRRIGAVIGAGPLIGRSRFATRSDSARRTVVTAGVGFAAAAACDVVVAPVRTAARAWGGSAAAAVRASAVAVRAFAVIVTAGVPTARIGHRDRHAGPAYEKTRGHDTDTCREAEVRLGHSSSPAGGKDMQTGADWILACRCPVEPPLRRKMQINVSSAIHPRRTYAIGR